MSKVNVVTDGSSKCLMASSTSTKAMPYRPKSQESLLTYCSRFSSCSVVGGTNEGVRTFLSLRPDFTAQTTSPQNHDLVKEDAVKYAMKVSTLLLMTSYNVSKLPK